MALGSTQPLTKMNTSNLPGGVKGGQGVGLTNLPPSVSRVSRQNIGASTSHNPMGLHVLLQGCLPLSVQLSIKHCHRNRLYVTHGLKADVKLTKNHPN
jgi:hypothetical protein